MQPNEEQRSLGQLFSDLTRESSELVRKEIELARLEFTQSISDLKTAVASMVIAVPLLFAGFLVLLLAAVFGLDQVLHRLWLSALIVGALVLAAGAVALLVGRGRMKRVDVKPERTVASLREDKEMVQRHVGAGAH
ncbi:MAG: phage holin family protein [Thermodesulfobacteriota bacterium]